MMIMKIWLPARMQEPKRCCYSSLVANDCTVSFFVSQSLSVMQTSTAVTFEVSNHSQRLGSPTTPTPLQLLVHSPPLYNFWFTPHPSATSGSLPTPRQLLGHSPPHPSTTSGSLLTPNPLQLLVHSPPLYKFWALPTPTV